IRWVGAGGVAARVGAAGSAVGDDPLPLEQAAFAQRGGPRAVGLVPDARRGPLLETSPAGAAPTAAPLLGQGLPTQAFAQDQEDAAPAVPVGPARPPALAGGQVLGQGEGNGLPPFVAQ